jgi:hypothetical protein
MLSRYRACEEVEKEMAPPKNLLLERIVAAERTGNPAATVLSGQSSP